MLQQGKLLDLALQQLALLVCIHLTNVRKTSSDIAGLCETIDKVHNSISAVAVDSDGSPVSVSWSGDARRNVIVWMDHRAVNQAQRINFRNSPVLKYCGGSVSPEMQAPKVSVSGYQF